MSRRAHAWLRLLLGLELWSHSAGLVNKPDLTRLPTGPPPKGWARNL